MSRRDESLWIREDGDRGKWRDAERARQNRREIRQALSKGEISRRDLIKWGLFTSAGMIAPIGGLSPFVRSAHAFMGGATGSGVPTGLTASPTFGVAPFTSPLYRFDILPQFYVPGSQAAQNPVPSIPQSEKALSPTPTAEANQTKQPVNPLLVQGKAGMTGPIEGRPPGPNWAHQRFAEFPPQVEIDVTVADATPNPQYNPGVSHEFNSGIDADPAVLFQFNPGFPVQTNNSMWTYNGTLPPKLIIARYGHPILFRLHNALTPDINQTGVNAFGTNTITTHEHNAHHGAENDGFTGAYFYPNQFYDYHYPWTLAGLTTINTGATDKRAGAPDGNGGIINVPGDWHETMSSHWFHDHRFTFTDQNVYKGIAGMTNIYSSLDRGNEALKDGVNLQLPSGSLQDYGNLEYDINLMFADKAWDSDGQLDMDTAQFAGFLGDQMTVNLCWKPFLQVYARKYRFRMLNASVSRFYIFALSDSSGNSQPMTYIANDGNLLPNPVAATTMLAAVDPANPTVGVPVTCLDQLGVAERFDVVIDFSAYPAGTKLYLVNLQRHTTPALPTAVNPLLAKTIPQAGITPLQTAMMVGGTDDPAIGPCLEFQVLGPPPTKDLSVVPNVLIPNPALPESVNTRNFTFGEFGDVTTNDPITTYEGNGTDGDTVLNPAGLQHWGISVANTPDFATRCPFPNSLATLPNPTVPLGDGNTDPGCQLDADFGRITSAPTYGTSETWTLHNGGLWDHPVHIHFEEGQIVMRNSDKAQVPDWEKGRKDVYRMRPGSTVTLQIQFRDWSGMFMAHCHNTMHEDNAMLLRWEVNSAGPIALPTPLPHPTGVTFEDPTEILAGAFPANPNDPAPFNNATTNGCAGAACANSPYLGE